MPGQNKADLLEEKLPLMRLIDDDTCQGCPETQPSLVQLNPLGHAWYPHVENQLELQIALQLKTVLAVDIVR